MTVRPAFTRALAALAHPVSLSAVLVLLLNDHLFKALWPGWVTGKLGDVAGLVFAPLLVAVPLSLLLPRRVGERAVGLTAIAITGAWWVLAVTVPDVHALSLSVLGVLTQAPFYFERDPTDALALPGLLGAWYAWWHSGARAGNGARPGGVVVAVLALLACVATSSFPNSYGASCLQWDGERLLVAVDRYDYQWFRSDDGGMRWVFAGPDAERGVRECAIPTPLTDPRTPLVQYRIEVGSQVQRSEDGGAHWQTDLDLLPIAGEVRLIQLHDALRDQRTGMQRETPPPRDVERVPVVRPRPLDAVVHPPTGNLVLSMGQDGILVREAATGRWQWVDVAGYRPQFTAPLTVDFLLPELLLALPLAPLLLLGMSNMFSSSTLRRLAFVTGVLLWFGAAGALSLSRTASPGIVSTVFIPEGVAALVFLGMFLPAVEALWVFHRRRLNAHWLALPTVVVVLLFLVPYGLWAMGAIPTHRLATAFAIVFAVVGGVAGYLATQRRSAHTVPLDQSN